MLRFPNIHVQSYPGDELLLVYDYDFKFGENFYICLTEEAKYWVLNVSISFDFFLPHQLIYM